MDENWEHYHDEEQHDNLIPCQGNGRRIARRKEALLHSLSEVIDAGVNTGAYYEGKYEKEFEQEVAQRWGFLAAVTVNSGTTALRLALEVLGIEKGREVIIPAVSYISTAYAVNDAGLVPVFVDVNPMTLNIDVDAISRAITPATAVILPVDFHGLMADMPAIVRLADEHGLYVVEDAAQAHGAALSYDEGQGRFRDFAGSLGDLGCFSLNSVKNLGGPGDGGMVTVGNRLQPHFGRITERLRAIREMGRYTPARYIHDGWGTRARINELMAAECLMELRELDGWNDRRREIAGMYDAILEHSDIRPVPRGDARAHVYYRYALKSPNVERRRELDAALVGANIEYDETHTIMSDQKAYRSGELACRVEPIPQAREATYCYTTVPVYPELSDQELERIMNVLRRFA